MKHTIARLICLALPMLLLSAREATNASSCLATPERLSAQLKESLNCIDVLASEWTENDTASAMESLKNAMKVLRKHQKTEPQQCPAPVPHANGGLVCVTIGNTRYCKPMCNEGHDFGFLRLSRLYEECTAGSEPSWTTQYIRGNRLAVCNEATIQVAGAKSTYFPKGQDCLKTKSDSKLETDLIEAFVSELDGRGIKGTAEEKSLICG